MRPHRGARSPRQRGPRTRSTRPEPAVFPSCHGPLLSSRNVEERESGHDPRTRQVVDNVAVSCRFAAVVAFVLLAPVGGAMGQTVTDMTGAISGRVTDQNSAALPGVTVTISSPRADGHARGLDQWRRGVPVPGPSASRVHARVYASRLRDAPSARPSRVGLGGTTTANEVMDVAGPGSEVTVDRGAPVLDRKSASIVVRFDAAKLANLPGPRSMGTILSAMPAVQLARFDVGGSSGLNSPPFSAYGSGATPPSSKGSTSFMINPFGLTLDYGSFQEVSLTSAGHGAAEAHTRSPLPVHHQGRGQSISGLVLRRLRGSALAGVQHQPDTDRTRAQPPATLCRARTTACGAITTSTPMWAASSGRTVSGGTPPLVCSQCRPRLVTFPVRSRIAPRAGTSVSRAPIASTPVTGWLSSPIGPTSRAEPARWIWPGRRRPHPTSSINPIRGFHLEAAGVRLDREGRVALDDREFRVCGGSCRPVCGTPGGDPQRRTSLDLKTSPPRS